MAEPVRIKLADERVAIALTQELFGRFRPELAQLDGRWEVRVHGDPSVDRILSDLLAAVERWLDESGLSAAAIEVDGHSYTLASRRSA